MDVNNQTTAPQGGGASVNQSRRLRSVNLSGVYLAQTALIAISAHCLPALVVR
jgi:hypothetical protein